MPSLRGLASRGRIAADILRHPANRHRRLRTLARACAWNIGSRISGRPYDLAVYGDLRLRCYTDSATAKLAMYYHDLGDTHETAFLKRYLEPGDGFIDVGANIGFYTLLAAALVGPAGEVHAFEPGAAARARLEENVAFNRLGQVRIHDAAAWSQTSDLTFRSQAGADDRNRIVLGDAARQAAPAEWIGLTVRGIRLDEALPDRTYAMGKLDVEGAELFALQGAERMLLAGNPAVWQIEMNGLLHDYGIGESQLAGWLSDRGYELSTYDADHNRLDFDVDAWRKRDNVLAVSSSQRERVITRLARRARPGSRRPAPRPDR